MALTQRDVLFAGIACFVAYGYAVYYVPYLRYVGYAFVAGTLGTLASIAALLIFSTRQIRPKQDARSPSIALLSRKVWEEDTAVFKENAKYKPKPLYPYNFMISDAIDSLLSLAMCDFVSSWYGGISRSPTFVNEVDRAIRVALANIRDRLFDMDIVEVAVSRIVPILTAHMKEFDLAERAVRGRSLNRNVTESEELDLAIAGKYRDGRLHPATSLGYSDTKLLQQEHLRKIVVKVLPEVLPEYMIQSRAVSVLIKEIVACAVLFPLMQLLSDPDTWNQIMENYGRTALQDRKTVRKLRAALDEHATPNPKSKQLQQFPRLSPGDTERSFERFIRAIRRCNNLSDARRFRSQVTSQLKRESMVEGLDQTYIRRLETGKRVLDQKVARLTALGGHPALTAPQSELRNGQSQSREIPLVDVMHNAAGLSYFMEYMDRQRMMTLVQFWIVVDGFRNPLEDDFGDDETEGILSWSDTDRLDIAQINETYLHKPELQVPEESRRAVKTFLEAGKKATAPQYRRARSAILMAQSAILESLEKRFYPGFKKSDLYYKYLTSDEAATGPLVPNMLSPVSPISPMESKPINAIPRNNSSKNARIAAPPMARTSSQPSKQASDLRRVAASSTDIRSPSKMIDEPNPARRSLDTDGRAPLFDDDYDTDPLANSTYSLGKDSQPDENKDSKEQTEVVEAMEAALNDIITNDPQSDREDEKPEEKSENHSFLFGSPNSNHRSGRETDSTRTSLDGTRLNSGGEKAKPSITSLGLVNESGRIGVFSDDDLFPDEDKFIEDEYADVESNEKEPDPEEQIHEAAPGDLGLAEAIAVLTEDIERLIAQESIVDTLTKKAELTNNAAELRILGKSKSSLQREIRRKELQRQQYMIQESDNSLYGRSSISVKSIMVGKEEDGREFALYMVEIHRKAGDQMPAASWVVARRYSEFHDLHHRLRMRYPSVQKLEFPRRRVVMKLQKDFLHKRRLALEQYLRQLLLLPDVCRSRELRAFLSQQAILPTSEGKEGERERETTNDIVTRIYNSVTDGMDDFLGNLTALDHLSAAGQSLIAAATSTTPSLTGAPTSSSSSSSPAVPPNTNVSVSPTTAAAETYPPRPSEAEAELLAYSSVEDANNIPTSSTALEPFVKPIADLFLETFDLTARGQNWLRGRAVVVVLHQLLGGTIERKTRDFYRSLTSTESILRYIAMVKDIMWPPPAPNGNPPSSIRGGGGGVKDSDRKLREQVIRSKTERERSKKEASVMLATLVPDLAGNVVGRMNAKEAARRVASSVNNGRLMGHLVYVILDEIVAVLFGETVVGGRPGRNA